MMEDIKLSKFTSYVVILCILILCYICQCKAAITANNCTEAEQERYDVMPNREDFLKLAMIPVPASCGDFVLSEMLICENEFRIASGCCFEECVQLFEKLSSKCVLDLRKSICDVDKQLYPYIDNVIKRCDDNDYLTYACDNYENELIEANSSTISEEVDLNEENNAIDEIGEKYFDTLEIEEQTETSSSIMVSTPNFIVVSYALILAYIISKVIL